MNTSFIDIAIDGKTFGLLLLGITVSILFLIFFIKKRLALKSNKNLAKDYENTIPKSPLQDRNKYPAVNIFKYRSTFLNLGIVIAISMALMAFDWTEFEKEVDLPRSLGEIEVDFIQDVIPTAPLPPPPPPPPPIIEVVPEGIINDEEIKDFESMDIDLYTEINQNENKFIKPIKEVEIEEDIIIEEDIDFWKVVEQMPRFPGCEDIDGSKDVKKSCADTKLLQFIHKRIKYPAIARDNGIEGRCFVSFIVEKDGSVTDVKLLRDIGGQCGQESLRVVNLMVKKQIKWTPGKQGGRNVRVQFNLPIHFRLNK